MPIVTSAGGARVDMVAQSQNKTIEELMEAMEAILVGLLEASE